MATASPVGAGVGSWVRGCMGVCVCVGAYYIYIFITSCMCANICMHICMCVYIHYLIYNHNICRRYRQGNKEWGPHGGGGGDHALRGRGKGRSRNTRNSQVLLLSLFALLVLKYKYFPEELRARRAQGAAR
jgi:hypothetical protein